MKVKGLIDGENEREKTDRRGVASLLQKTRRVLFKTRLTVFGGFSETMGDIDPQWPDLVRLGEFLGIRLLTISSSILLLLRHKQGVYSCWYTKCS
jgi:hypothetical protein